MSKKFSSLGLAAVLGSSLLSGCGDNKPTPQNKVNFGAPAPSMDSGYKMDNKPRVDYLVVSGVPISVNSDFSWSNSNTKLDHGYLGIGFVKNGDYKILTNESTPSYAELRIGPRSMSNDGKNFRDEVDRLVTIIQGDIKLGRAITITTNSPAGLPAVPGRGRVSNGARVYDIRGIYVEGLDFDFSEVLQ